MQEKFEIPVKNMVCNRCIKVVNEVLKQHNFPVVKVELGTVSFHRKLQEEEIRKMDEILRPEGFEVLKSKEEKIIHRIKTIIIELIHYKREKPANEKLSEYLARELHADYSTLGKLFSQYTGKTIERYVIEQRIERAKELLKYGELSLKEISYELNYSSPQHLSRQFKQITGMTPSAFKKMGTRKKLDNI